MKRIYNPDNLSEAQLWVLGLNYIQANRDENIYYDTLPKSNNDQKLIQKTIKILDKDWGIKNKEEFLEKSGLFMELNYTKQYNRKIQFFSTLSTTAQDNYINKFGINTNDYISYKIIKSYCNKLPKAGIAAFDYSRYIYVCRKAFFAGFIDEGEAWNLMFKVAKAVQEAYSSWREYVLAYEVGKQLIKSKKLTKELFENETPYISKLILEEDSPLRKLDWNTKLEYSSNYK